MSQDVKPWRITIGAYMMATTKKTSQILHSTLSLSLSLSPRDHMRQEIGSSCAEGNCSVIPVFIQALCPSTSVGYSQCLQTSGNNPDGKQLRSLPSAGSQQPPCTGEARETSRRWAANGQIRTFYDV